MKVLVTGGCGFIGSQVVSLLLEHGHEVISVDLHHSFNTIDLQNHHIKPIRHYQMDIRDANLKSIFERERPEVVYHLAAQSVVPPSIQDPLYDQSVNIGGTIHLLELMRQYQTKKIVFSSSAAVYGNPTSLPIQESHPIQPLSPYGLSKWTAEQYILLYQRLYQMDYTILRYANVYGPGQTAEGEGGVITLFMEKIKQNQALVIYGDGQQTRDFVYVKDIAYANLLALESGNQQTLNIGSGIEISVNQIVAYLERIKGAPLKLEQHKPREGDIEKSCLDATLAYQQLGWQATTTIFDGLKQFKIEDA